MYAADLPTRPSAVSAYRVHAARARAAVPRAACRSATGTGHGALAAEAGVFHRHPS